MPNSFFPITLITDCLGPNASMRQGNLYKSLLGVNPLLVPVLNTFEAAGNIVDALDSIGERGIIIANVAPRNGVQSKHENGTPFAYTWIGSVLIVATVDGYVWSLLKKLGLLDDKNIYTISLEIALVEAGVSQTEAKRKARSQFRSYECIPEIAAYIWSNGELSNESREIFDAQNFPEIPQAIWWIDNFGNAKTTILPHEIGFVAGQTIQLGEWGDIPCCVSLRDVSDNEFALIIGSSGYDDRRFVEYIMQGKSIKNHFDLRTGMSLQVTRAVN